MTALSLPSLIVFFAAASWALLAFYKATNSGRWLKFTLIWLILQGGLALTGFYRHNTVPPRMMLITVLPLIFVITHLFTPKGRNFLASLDVSWLIAYHLVRIPVEIGLFLLANEKKVPLGMTFEAGNFDIFSGVSALFVLFLQLSGRLTSKILLVWNAICLSLLLYIMITANLSVPGPLQRLNFDRPNIGFRYFPAVWLPSFIAPTALLCHLAIFVKLLRSKAFSVDQ